MKNRNNTLPLISALIVVSVQFGCAMPFVAPTSGPTAKIRVVMTKDDYIIHTDIFLNGMCKGKQTLGVLGKEGAFGPEGKGEASTLNMFDGKTIWDPKRKERIVQAERPLTIGLVAVGGYGFQLYRCNQDVTFVPKKNSEYEVRHDINDKICILEVNELTLASDGAVKRTPVEDVQRENRRCWW